MSTPSVPSPDIALTRRAALAALALAVLVIGGAWFSQLVLGLAPCELCLLQRWPYYVGIPVAAVAALLAASAPRHPLVAPLLLLVALIFVVSAGLGVYHSGVEWRFWEGPTACTGQYVSPTSTDDFFKSLEGGPAVRCDEAAVRILGLSLAGWNVVASLLIVAMALIGARAARRA
jgi:disulfide bond formation protein DsbB